MELMHPNTILLVSQIIMLQKKLPIHIVTQLVPTAYVVWSLILKQLTHFTGSLVRDQIPFKHLDRKSTRLNSSHVRISYAVFCLKKKKKQQKNKVYRTDKY